MNNIKLAYILTISISCFLLFVNQSVIYSQSKPFKNVDEASVLYKPHQISEVDAIKEIVKILTTVYANEFLYTRNVHAGNYIINKTTAGYEVLFLDNNRKAIDKITLSYSKHTKGKPELILNKNDVDRLIKNTASSNTLRSGEPCSEIFTIHTTNHMLWDKEILNTEEFSLGKIMNRGIALENLIDQYDNPLRLFYNLTDGVIIPYDGGQNSIVLAADKKWHSIVYIDKNQEDVGIRYYAEYGTGSNQLSSPTGITFGREDDQGASSIYPIFISDQINERVVSINYMATSSGDGAGFQTGSFAVVDSLRFPYDIVYFASVNEKEDDKLWVSLSPIVAPSLTCLSPEGGIVQENIRGYVYNNDGIDVSVLFPSNSRIRMAVFSGSSYSALCFIDNINNALVSCRLTEDGLADTLISQSGYYLIKAEDHLSFPAEHRLSSVSFQKTNMASELWTNLWVTSGYSTPLLGSSSMVHAFKMNKQVRTQYLGSSNKPYNTDLSFSKLTNINTNNGFIDIFTSENWAQNYGLRRFWPYADMRCDYVNDYKRHSDINVDSFSVDSTGYFNWTKVLTNDCQVKFHVEKQVDTTWETVEIKRIDGETIEAEQPVLYRSAGVESTQLELNLELEDLMLGRQLRLTVKLYPEYANTETWLNTVVTASYNFKVDKKSFMPTQGGCPFIYVLSENQAYKLDNNIIHKSEYNGISGDYTDKYILNIAPEAVENFVYISAIENEHDVSHINKFKFYVIDYPEENNIALTEDNQIALFEPGDVISTDSATRNGSAITNLIQYSQTGHKVYGLPNDSSFVRFPSTLKRKGYSKKQNIDGRGTLDSTYAVIIDMKDTITAPSAKYWAGYMNSIQNSGDTVSRYFSRRERKSVTILPIPLSISSGDYVDFLNIDWLSNFRVKYISLATNVQYNSNYIENGYDVYSASKINLINKTSVTSDLVANDSLSATLDSTCIITFKFDISRLGAVQSGYKRAYILETIGHYSIPNANSDKIPVVIPKEFTLSQNYPNPFNPTTKINFELPKNTQVSLVIYDILGREVMRLANNEYKQAGRYTVEFDGRNYASGVYFYRIEAGNFVQAKKMVLVK